MNLWHFCDTAGQKVKHTGNVINRMPEGSAYLADKHMK